MTTDLDIYRTANVLVKHYGEDAALEADQRADAMLEKAIKLDPGYSRANAAAIRTKPGTSILARYRRTGLSPLTS